MVFSSYSFTNQGGRDENQDSVACREGNACGIYVVADGLGGHQNGQMASAAAVDSLCLAWEEGKPEDLSGWLFENISAANAKILEMQREKRSTMKTTVVALVLEDGQAVWANTGDSRLYHLRDGKLLSVTEDHSVAYKKYKAGKITRAQINTDEDQSSLLKALGNEDRWEPDMYSEELLPGDGFMLCTDGLWEYIYDDEVLVDWLKADTPEKWAELLMLRAIHRIGPGNDNLSVLTVMVE